MSELDELIQYWKDYAATHAIAMTYPIGRHIRLTLEKLLLLKKILEAQP